MNELFTSSLEPAKEKSEQSLEKVWSLIGELQINLRSLGLDVTDRNFRKEVFFNETAEAGIPVVSDGLDGVRVSFKKESFERYGIKRDEFYNLKLWFTNGFEKPDNEIRQKIQASWDELMKKHFSE